MVELLGMYLFCQETLFPRLRHGLSSKMHNTMLSRLLLASYFAAGALGKKPNIVFLLTDDQDLHMNSLDYMHGVQHHLV